MRYRFAPVFVRHDKNHRFKMFPQIIIFIIKNTAIVSIDHMSLIILIVAFFDSVRRTYVHARG